MTDDYSGSFSGTQEKSIIENATNKKKGGNKKQNTEEITPLQCYDRGKALFETKLGVRLVVDQGGAFCCHRLYDNKVPEYMSGLDLPNWFRPVTEVTSYHEAVKYKREFESLARSEFGSDAEDIIDFWSPFWFNKPGSTDISMLLERMVILNNQSIVQNIHKPQFYNQTFDPMGRIGEQVSSPAIWLPDREWFSPKVRELEFDDIFTLFPKAELELWKLGLGRVGVGRHNHIPPGFTEPISHTARMLFVIIGQEAGQGKSTTANWLAEAISYCGYSVHTFKKTGDRFGLKQAAMSDIALKDDVTIETLQVFLKTEETKILATNGLLSVEEKFQAKEQLWPRCLLICNANDWSPNFSYELDSGVVSRVKILSTRRNSELDKANKFVKVVGEEAPDLKPFIYLPWLADKLNVDKRVLMLWGMRLATDHFWNIISDKSDPSENKLETEVKYWTQRQRIRFKSDAASSIINAMMFSKLIRTDSRGFTKLKEDDPSIPELHLDVFYSCLADFYFILVEPKCYKLLNILKNDWEEHGRYALHPYQGFRELNPKVIAQTLETANSLLIERNERRPSQAEAFREVMSKLVLRDGFRLSGGMTYLVEYWENCRAGLKNLVDMTKKFKQELKDLDVDQYKVVIDTNLLEPTKSWMGSNIGKDISEYSPDKAEKLKIAYINNTNSETKKDAK